MPARRGAAFRALALRGDTGGDMSKRKTKETGGADLPMVAGVERLRRVCDILQCDFSVAFNACENDILARGDVAAKLCEILTCEAAFDDCGIDRELRRIAPLAITERHEKLNAHFGVHNAAPEITEADIEEFINDFCAEETSLSLVRLFGDLAGTEIKYIDDPQEIRAKKTAYIVERDTRDLRRTIGQWLYYSRAESIADLAGELRRECAAKKWESERQDVIDDFVTVARLREIAFIAKAESRRAESAHCGGIGAGAAQGAANPSGNAGGGVAIDTPPAPKKQRAGHTAGGVSQSDMARYMGVTKRTIQNWENHADRYPPPIVDGAQYTAAIRENGAGAFVFAARYKDTKRGAGKTIGGKGAEIEHEKAAFQKWENGGRDDFYKGISD